MIKVDIINIRYQSDITLRIQENVFQGKIISSSLLKINFFWQIIHLVQGPIKSVEDQLETEHLPCLVDVTGSALNWYFFRLHDICMNLMGYLETRAMSNWFVFHIHFLYMVFGQFYSLI